jgi:hypothetical protein
MKNSTYLFAILSTLFIIFLNSCRTKQVVTQTLTTTVHDTIRDVRIVERFKPVHDTLIVDNPCDSAGILTTFYSKLSAPQGTVIIRSYKGKIQATVSLDSMKQVYEARYKSFVGKNVEIREKLVVKNVIPTWIIVALFFESMIILLYLYFKFIFPK